MDDIANKESRAPLYLLQITGKMNRKQFEVFLPTKLKLELDAEVIDLLFSLYGCDSNGRVLDVPRLLADAVESADETLSSTNQTQDVSLRKQHPTDTSTDFFVNGGGLAATNRPQSAPADRLSPRKPIPNSMTEVHAMPHSLRAISKSPAEIRQLLQVKLFAKCPSKNPLSVLHNVFRSDSDTSRDSRIASKQKLRQVLIVNDILVSDREFDAFFADLSLPHDPNSFEVRKLLVSLLPPDFLVDKGLTSVTALVNPDRHGNTTAVNSAAVRVGEEQQEAFHLAEQLLVSLTGPPTTSQREARKIAPILAEEYHARKVTMMAGEEMAWMLAGQPGTAPVVVAPLNYGTLLANRPSLTTDEGPTTSRTPTPHSQRSQSPRLDIASHEFVAPRSSRSPSMSRSKELVAGPARGHSSNQNLQLIPRVSPHPDNRHGSISLTISPVRPSSAPSTSSRSSARRAYARPTSSGRCHGGTHE